METEKVKDPETINNKQDEDCLGKENVEKKQNEKKKTEDIEEKHIQSVKEILNDIESKEDNRNIIIQYRIENNHGVIAGDRAMFDNVSFNQHFAPKDKEKTGKDIAADEEALTDWIYENYEKYIMTFLFACAVFEKSLYSWIGEAANHLYDLWTFENKEDQRIVPAKRLEELGAVKCEGVLNTEAGMVKTNIIQMKEESYRSRILKIVWQEFPQLRGKIVEWLKHYALGSRILLSKCAVQVMGELACMDYHYFMDDMLKLIFQEPSFSNDMIAAQVLISLYNFKEYKENVINMLHKWNDRNEIHHLLTNLLVCVAIDEKSGIMEKAIYKYMQKALEGIEEENENIYLEYIYDFFACGMRKVGFYRILIEWMCRKINKNTSIKRKQNIVETFVRLFAADIWLMRYEVGEDAIFIKLCFSDQAISREICFLWQNVWRCWDYRATFYVILGEYYSRMQKSDDEMRKFIRKIIGTQAPDSIQEDILVKIRKNVRKKNERVYN